MDNELLTKKQAAEYMQCSERTLEKRVKDGTLKGAVRRYGRLVRFYKPALEQAGRNVDVDLESNAA